MKRLLLVAFLSVLAVGTASADYVVIKIDVNKMNFFPPQNAAGPGQPNAGGAGAMMPGAMQPGNMMPGGMGMMPGGMGGMRGGMGGMRGMQGGMRGMQGGMRGMQGGMRGMPGMGGGGGAYGGMRPGAYPMQPGPGPGPMQTGPGGANAAPPNLLEDPDARWISAIVELKAKPAAISNSSTGLIMQVDHRWGNKNWMSLSPTSFPIMYGFDQYIIHEPFSKEFETKLNKAKKEKTKDVEAILHIARFALSRAHLKEFHRAMKEAVDVDAKHPVVKSYQKVKKELAKSFDKIDPTQAELIRELQADKYEPFLSEQKHYCLYAQFFKTDKHTETVVRRRLALMEETLETFYYWFAVQKIEPGQAAPLQPGLPKYRLMAVLTNGKEEFLSRHEQWGSLPMVGDGFTPRRDNFIVLSAKSRIDDPLYTEFDKLITDRLQEANVKLQPLRISISRDDLLSGKINENKTAGQAAFYIGAAQASVLLAKTLEDESERCTITNEGIRQLLIASDMFPRNVQVPDWMVEGLAAFFETSPGSLYPTIGRPSWLHLVSFKHLTKGMQKEAPNLLFNVVTDRYFRDARKLSAELNENRDNEHLHLATTEAWELARCTAWSFVYYLSQSRKLDMLFQYGKELNDLPRDMDLSDTVMQGSFARAFGMTEPRNPRRIAQAPLANMAVSWFNMMDETNLDILKAQSYLLEERAHQESAHMLHETKKSSAAPKKGVAPGINPGTNPNPNPGAAQPMPMPGQPTPMPGQPMPPGQGKQMPPSKKLRPTPPNPGTGATGAVNLSNSKWAGSETLKNFDKLSFQFNAGGQVTMTDKAGLTQGTYSLTGNSLTLQFPGGVRYTGTVNGTALGGNATNGMDNWNWTVTKMGP